MSPGKLIWPILACFLFLYTPLTAAPANWWNPNWSYRIPLSIEAANTEFNERPIAATINFTVALKAARSRGIFVSNTVRLVEVNQAGAVVDESVPLQFDFAPDYHATRNAQGTLLFLPKSGATTPRRFHLYFETHEARNLTTLLAPYRLSETLRMSSPELSEPSSEQVNVNVGEIEIRPAKAAMRSRTVTMENGKQTDSPGSELEAPKPPWHSKPEHQFFAGYCTWYAARKWKEFTGAPVTWSGDGGRWFDNAADEGRNVSDDPKAAVKGAIIVWTRRGSAGHVAFVEAVNEEGVFITEMNARGRWMVSDAFLPFTNLDKGTKYRFKGYILPE